jgi:uncharacterized protein YfaP (DUF2135 family)
LRTTANRATTTALALLLLAACNGDSPDSPLSPSDLGSLDLDSLVAAMSVGGAQATLTRGQAPAPRGGPSITASGNQTVVNGGTLNVAIAAATPFQTVYMYAGGTTLGLSADAAGGIDGYYEVRLPASQTSASALLVFPQSVPLPEFELLFAVADASGVVGPFTRLSTNVTQVGTGDVQVTLTWDTDADVDLHVVDPRGEEVYYGNASAASGGELDLDSNAGCSVDGIRNENITWPVGRAPRGVYTVRVDYWSNCGAAQTSYTVRVNNGGSVQIFTGSFTGSGDNGGAGSGRFITSFERTTGPTSLTTSTTAGARPILPTLKGKTLVAPR